MPWGVLENLSKLSSLGIFGNYCCSYRSVVCCCVFGGYWKNNVFNDRAPWPRAKYFLFLPDLNSVKKHFIIWSLLFFSHHLFIFLLFLSSWGTFALFRAHFQRTNHITQFIWEASKVYLKTQTEKYITIQLLLTKFTTKSSYFRLHVIRILVQHVIKRKS